jgi:DNA polymerase III gamma/tau subunit
LGLTDEKTLFDVSSAIIDRDGGKILEILEELFSAGKNISVFIDDLCEYFKNLMVAKLSNSLSSGIPEHILRDYQTLAQKTDEKFLLDCLNTLCNAQNAIKFCTSEKVFAQTTLLSLLYNNNMEIEMLKRKVKNLENSLGENNAQKKTIIDYCVVEKQNVASKVDEKHTQSDSQIEIKTIEKQTQGEKIKDLQMQNAQNGSQQVDLQEKSVSQNISASAKEILGGLVKHARQNGEMMLFAGMNDVDSASICDGCFCVECKTDMCVELIEEHKEFILNYLKGEFGINNISCSVEVDKEKEKQKKLKELFDGKIKFI